MNILFLRSGARRGNLPAAISVLSFLLLLGSCSDNGGTNPGSLRFGQLGEIRVSLEVPLLYDGGAGELQQIFTWNSNGAWVLRETISYRTIAGDENISRSEAGVGGLELAYFTLITHFNDDPVLKLLTPELPQDLDPTCPVGGTRVTFRIRDDVRNETANWVRCAEGSLSTLKTSEAGPDVEAVRAIQAAILVRDAAYVEGFTSSFIGSVPFGTLDRGEESGARLEESRAFYSSADGVIETPEGWVEFWRAHTDNLVAQPPVVDWANEIVFAIAVGRRTEAGDSVEVRRILVTGEETRVDVVQRRPGNFCSPAAHDHYPIHIVVAPRTLIPIRFIEAEPELVHCGS